MRPPAIGRPIGVFAIATLAIALCGCGTATPTPAASGVSDAVVPANAGLLGGGGMGDLWGQWQAEPIAIPAALLPKVDAACRAGMQPFPPIPLVALDARGEGLVQALFAGPNGQAFCQDMSINRDGTVEALGGGYTSIGQLPPGPAPFALENAGGMGSGGGPNGGSSRVVANGRAGPGITAVVIEVPGRGRISASLTNGWYIAAFPGDWPPGTTVIGLDATGDEVATTGP